MFYENYQENKQFQAQTNIKPMKYGLDSKQIKSKKNTYKFNIDRDRKIQISSDFDNGNISLIKQVTELQYRLQCAPDIPNGNNKKSWFYFKVTAAKYIKLRFYVQGIGIYQSMYQEYNWAKPVYRIGQQGKWSTLNDSYLILRDQVNLMMDYSFQTEQPVYFAMSIPFAYWQMEYYLNNLKYVAPESLNYEDEVILETKTKKNLHMITIEDKELKKYKQSSNSSRCIILITSRVHPGEVSGSFCLMGMLDFILRPFSLQSQILRKMFTFVIFPIVNPQGVYQGNYRMDLNGQNLNRVYLQPNPSKHQTVFAIKQKINEFLKRGDKIMFHFDLHSHSTLRKSFIYGNAFDDIILQAQTEIFCKLLDGNCKYFQQSLSQFGQKHMKFKDKGQNMSKQGCARVVLSKMAGITYSYTIQSSIFPIEAKSYSQDRNRSRYSEPINLQFQIQSFSYDNFEDKSRQYSEQPNIIDQNKLLGNRIMLTILDLLNKNPYSSLQQKDIDQIRKQIAFRILQSQQRFKMLDTKAYHKSKFISQFAKNQFYSKYKDEWNWLISHKKFNNVPWPTNFVWFKYKSQREFKRTNSTKNQIKQGKLQTIDQIDYTALSQRCSELINKLKQNQENIISNKCQAQRLPMIRKSLQNRRIKTDQKKDLSENFRIQQTQKFKKSSRNVLVTNRSNILLTFLDDQQQRNQKRKINKKRMISLRMAGLNKNDGQKSANSEKLITNQSQSVEKQLLIEPKTVNQQLVSLKASHSQGQLQIINIKEKQRSSYQHKQRPNEQQGAQFQDKQLSKNIEGRQSRKQILNRKISMLKKVNQIKKNANKISMMKFPQIGKAFLITNAKKKLQRMKTTIQQQQNQQKSTIQSTQIIIQKIGTRVKTQTSAN